MFETKTIKVFTNIIYIKDEEEETHNMIVKVW